MLVELHKLVKKLVPQALYEVPIGFDFANNIAVEYKLDFTGSLDTGEYIEHNLQIRVISTRDNKVKAMEEVDNIANQVLDNSFYRLDKRYHIFKNDSFLTSYRADNKESFVLQFKIREYK